MKKVELSKGKIFLIICISLLIVFIGNKLYTNKVISNMEKQVSNVIEPAIEKIKLTTIEEMENGEKINHKYTIKFKSVELAPYSQENIKKILRGRAYVDYAICDEEQNEWEIGKLTIPVIREDKKGKFEIDWTKINSSGGYDFFIKDIIDVYDYQEYRNYEEFMKEIISFNSEDEEMFSEHSGSGRDNRENIKFDENGKLTKEDTFKYTMVWTGAVVSMSFQCEYNIKEFTGETSGDGIIINIKRTAISKDPLWFAEIYDIEKIDFYRDRGTDKEPIEVSDKDKIEKVLEVLSLYKYEYLLNEQYYELKDGIREDMHISVGIKNGPNMHMIINENGVFVSNQQVIISSEKSREILEKLMKIVQE